GWIGLLELVENLRDLVLRLRLEEGIGDLAAVVVIELVRRADQCPRTSEELLACAWIVVEIRDELLEHVELCVAVPIEKALQVLELGDEHVVFDVAARGGRAARDQL